MMMWCGCCTTLVICICAACCVQVQDPISAAVLTVIYTMPVTPSSPTYLSDGLFVAVSARLLQPRAPCRTLVLAPTRFVQLFSWKVHGSSSC
jgi:hypothetical protein